MTETSKPIEVGVPQQGLVLLVGISGSGKSTFAHRHFKPTEVVSSDVFRGLVSDDESDQSATPDAFDVLHYLVNTRLRRGLLTVVDATNVQQAARAALVKLAKSNDLLVDAIVLDVPVEVAHERNQQRTERNFAVRVLERQHNDLKKSLRGLKKEGLRRVHHLRGSEQIDAVQIVRQPSWNDKRELTGPFDIIGDVHGCSEELRTLLVELGWQLEYDDQQRAVGAHHPAGRTALFVGDLVDRGPDTPGVLRLVMGMAEAGTALSVSGNHEAKLVRALKGSNVNVSHGLAESLAQLDEQTDEFRAAVLSFMDGLISHFVLDRGNLVVAHAGLKEAYHGRASGRVRSFALYGDTTGESDEYGLPVRLPWANDYRGKAMVVYGHTPVASAEWINNTICLDTGAVFGGELTALRYPERELVSVPAIQQWSEPIKPLTASPSAREPEVLQIGDVAGTRWLTGDGFGKVKIPEENAAAALEIMSRFAVDPRWLIYLPPTMSPVATSSVPGYLEHPVEAFDEFAKWGASQVICEEKHMGSRAIAVLARDEQVAERRFGIDDGSSGAVYTRTGRAFFPGDDLITQLRDDVAPLFESLNTDWLALDCELLPWSVKAEALIRQQYASVGAAARVALPAAQSVIAQAAERGLPVAELAGRLEVRRENAAAFQRAYASYVEPTDGLAGIRVAPFQILAIEGEVTAATRTHSWHLAQFEGLTGGLVAPTRNRVVELADQSQRDAAIDWWLALTEAGGEGMVVKPAEPVTGKVQPGVKVRGREYLRIIYGPDYLDSLEQLRNRNLGKKRNLALREHGLGLEAITKFVNGDPLWQVHQLVFAVLALESEPVDPRL